MSASSPFCFWPSSPPEPHYWKPLLGDAEVVYGLAPERTWPHRSPTWLGQLFRAARRADVIVGAQEASSTYFAILAAKLTRKPVLGLIQNSLPDHLEQMPHIHRTLVRLLYPLLTGAVAVSDGVKESLEALVPALKTRVTTAYNLIEVEQIRAASQRGSQRDSQREATLPPRPYIIAVGRFSYQKGFDLLLRAYAALRARGFEHTLVILGNGSQRADLETLAEEPRRQGARRHAGFSGQPLPLDSRRGGVRLEFALRGLLPRHRRSVSGGVRPWSPPTARAAPTRSCRGVATGVLVKNEDLDALVEAVRSLLCDPARLRTLSEIGPARAEAFAVGAAPKAFEAALLKALSDEPRAE